MDQKKHFKMVELLLQHTRGGSIDWKATSSAETISVSFDKVSLLLSRLPSQVSQDESDYLIQIIGATGDIVEEFRDTDFENKTLEAFKMLGEVFELGRRKALGTDEAIDSIIEELSNIIPF